MIHKNRANRRYRDYTKAKRKADLAAHCWHYDNLHELSKGKIHCSCPLCAAKTRKVLLNSTKGRYKKNYSPADKRKEDSLNFKEKED